ncbi:hypothetical protein [Echinicola vietnamensis]|uniref:Putative membrane protein (DUF2306) n=1 Tax=Echinicola vietnamensis (strain DSM 17526 / LMG 23754 / KMM 6221) TaxID=926556 RepID=L0FWQ5_ECHVK|nr:hypothetical protein [Echinicola vietnamensis]AGA77186.1 putative membrane protein (DUF2306) [Echinicola vietnamensis DSM 17526]
MDVTIFDFILGLHIVGGGVGLLFGTIAMIRPKGDGPHRKFGKGFYVGMLLASLSGLVLSVMHPNTFLFVIGAFTLYMVGSGYRYLKLKGLPHRNKAKWIDWGLSGMMILFALAFFVQGARSLSQGNFFGVVMLVFGAIGTLMVYGDIKFYQGIIKSRTFWLRGHIARMCGAYIASLTAFLVVNIYFLPPLVIWLLPTVIITPLIVKWSRKYKMGEREEPADLS